MIRDGDETFARPAQLITRETRWIFNEFRVDVGEDSDWRSRFSPFEVISIFLMIHVAYLKVQHLHLWHLFLNVTLVKVWKDPNYGQNLMMRVDSIVLRFDISNGLR
jgi:hypothetical protein